jgi:glycine cleavage system H lipoate-binding protein
VNAEPYEAGWMIEIEPASEGELAELMFADAYANLLAST